MVDFHIGNIEGFTGKKIMELEGLEGLLITAISREGDLIIPDGSTRLMEEDVIHVIGKAKNINKLGEKLKINMDKKRTKKVMILGGGKIGYYLAHRLESSNVSVTIVEEDKARCHYLSEKLNHAMIIHGDGTDINLLEEEDLALQDAFVGGYRL